MLHSKVVQCELCVASFGSTDNILLLYTIRVCYRVSWRLNSARDTEMHRCIYGEKMNGSVEL